MATPINKPEAYAIDGYSSLHVLSPLPDTFPDVAEVVLDRLPYYHESTSLQIHKKKLN